MRIRYLAVGDELLRGETQEGNGLVLRETLSSLSLSLSELRIVPDDRGAIARGLEGASEFDLIVISGGLGPTDDDFTRSAVAEALGVPLEKDPVVSAALRERYARWGRRYAEQNDRQAERPVGSRLLENPVGTAPGFFLKQDRRAVATFPGVPSEFRAMLAMHLPRVLADCGFAAAPVKEVTLRLFGIPESEMQARIAMLPHYSRVKMRSLPSFPEIRLKLAEEKGDAEGWDSAVREVRAALGWRIYGEGDSDTLAAVVVRALKKAGVQTQVSEEFATTGAGVVRLLLEGELAEECIGQVLQPEASHFLVVRGLDAERVSIEWGGPAFPGGPWKREVVRRTFQGKRAWVLVSYSALSFLLRSLGRSDFGQPEFGE